MHYDIERNIQKEVEQMLDRGWGSDCDWGITHYDIERIIQREVEYRLDRGLGSDCN